MAKTEFTHPELGQEIRSLAGYYVPREEQIMPYRGKEVLLLLGDACIDSSCCGCASWSYIQVPGFLVRKHVRGSAEKPQVSEVDTIEDKAVRDGLVQSLGEKYPGARVEVW
ncbi:MAG TPA: hypothetical protein VN415_02815 [Dehalococcoidia bacterium]|jgi:hypothetical protein|nr:hypothetical protein [Dehalococcoidia bacterium]